jgi:hypothetical protein
MPQASRGKRLPDACRVPRSGNDIVRPRSEHSVNAHDAKPSPEFQLIWPLRALISLPAGPKRRTAVVLSLGGVDEFTRVLLSTGLVARLVESGVELFAIAGYESEQAHDALDWALDEMGADEVVTSWHDQDDPDDTASFVVASAQASGLTRLVVVLDESTASGVRLRNAILTEARLHPPFIYYWGDTVRVATTAPANMRPGELGSVCGMEEVGNRRQYTVEYSDGSSTEILEEWLERADDE